MSDWSALLDRLADVPRENGSEQLRETGVWLADVLRAAGWNVDLVPYRAYPHEMQMLGAAMVVLGLLYLVLMRHRRYFAALALAVATPALTIAVVELRLPALGGFGATTQQNVVATLPVENPDQRLILSAHYDTKTELLDHVARTPLQLLAVPMFGLLLVAPLRGLFRRLRGDAPGRWERVGGPAAAVYGAAIGLVYAAGAVIPARSPGAMDDGAACAVLVRAAEVTAAAARPLRTELQIVLFSGEELAAQGSWSWTGSRFRDGAKIPTAAVNLELVGAGRQFLSGGETSLMRHHRPPGALLDAIDRALAATGAEPLYRTRASGLTDAVAFLAHGIPAASVVGREGPFLIPRGMHSAGDRRERLDPAALELTLGFVRELIAQTEEGGLPDGLAPLPTRAPASDR